MGEKDDDKRVAKLEKRIKELEDRLAKLEKTGKKAAKAGKETVTDKLAEMERAVRSNEREPADM